MTFKRITYDPKRNAEPCIRQLRLTVRRVVEAVAIFPDRRDLLQEYPELEEEDILEALAYTEANRPQPSKIERRLSSLVYSRGFLTAFFLAGTIALVIGFYLRPGTAVVALPLLAWCPFLLLLGLLESVQEFRRVRRSRISIFAAIQALAMWWGLCGYLCYFAVSFLRGRDLAQWPLWPLLFVMLFGGGYSRSSEGEGIDARGKRRRLFGLASRR